MPPKMFEHPCLLGASYGLSLRQTGSESFPSDSMPIARWAIISRDGEAGWCGRRKHQVVSHGASLFLLGGYTSAGVIGAGHGAGANLNDVWKSTEGAVRVAVLHSACLSLVCWWRRYVPCGLLFDIRLRICFKANLFLGAQNVRST